MSISLEIWLNQLPLSKGIIMTFCIKSDIVLLNKNLCTDNLSVETELEKTYKDIIRWAIVEVSDNMCKINVSYKTETN